MAAVGGNIRALHRELAGRGKNCTLEWNNGGHFKDADLRTAKAFRWLTVLTLWCVLSFTGVTTFIYSNF